ncbi:hypothetical protein EYF80_032238 [Liparis tanakae]|uniref:Uncharacterized protein n=1 Tax=Liparis tanakae TaxID=230148 RepID=A0A4Z2GY38_9TELE|nr:hypothetical protein EYF80_032238 [Liparis tanakae]
MTYDELLSNLSGIDPWDEARRPLRDLEGNNNNNREIIFTNTGPLCLMWDHAESFQPTSDRSRRLVTGAELQNRRDYSAAFLKLCCSHLKEEEHNRSPICFCCDEIVRVVFAARLRAHCLAPSPSLSPLGIPPTFVTVHVTCLGVRVTGQCISKCTQSAHRGVSRGLRLLVYSYQNDGGVVVLHPTSETRGRGGWQKEEEGEEEEEEEEEEQGVGGCNVLGERRATPPPVELQRYRDSSLRPPEINGRIVKNKHAPGESVETGSDNRDREVQMWSHQQR